MFVVGEHSDKKEGIFLSADPFKENKSTLDNSPPPLLKLKLLLRPQGQIIDVKCEKSQ